MSTVLLPAQSYYYPAYPSHYNYGYPYSPYSQQPSVDRQRDYETPGNYYYAPGAPAAYRANPNRPTRPSTYYAGRYVTPGNYASPASVKVTRPREPTTLYGSYGSAPASPNSSSPAPSPANTTQQPAAYYIPGLGVIKVPSAPAVPTPAPEPVLTTEDVKRIQSHLLRLGYELGWADGTLGPKTRAALLRFQRDNGIVDATPTGMATLQMLDSLAGVLKTVQKLRDYVPRNDRPAYNKTTIVTAPASANPVMASGR